MHTIQIFQHALQQWQDREPAGHEEVHSFAHELKEICSENTNLYVVDMQPDDPFSFPTDLLLENVDMKGRMSTFRDYPDHDYLVRDVLPFYVGIKQSGEASLLRMQSSIQGHFAVYDRMLLPMKDGNESRWAISITKTRLLIPPAPNLRSLTERQQDILTIMAQGFSSKEAALRLGISYRTVEHQLVTIRSKLDARNIAHAIAIFAGNQSRQS